MAGHKKNPSPIGGRRPVPPSVSGRIRRELHYYRAILADPRTPKIARWLISGGVAYLLLPFDLLPDFIPFVGKLDDLLIAPALIGLGMKLVPQKVKDNDRYRTKRLYAAMDSRSIEPAPIRYEALPAPFGIRIHADEVAADTFGSIGRLSLDLMYRHRLVVIGGPMQPSDPFDDSRLRTSTAGDAGTCSMQTLLDIDFRPLPLIAAVTYCMSLREPQRSFSDLEAAFAVLPDDLVRELECMRLRRVLHPSMSLEAVLDNGTWPANDYAHRLSGAQFLNLLLDIDTRIVGASGKRARRIRGDVSDFLRQREFTYTHSPTIGRLIVWDPRRIQQVASGRTIDAQRYIYPDDVFNTDLLQ